MADAQKINPNETLRTSYPKINQAIENSNQAKKDSEEALQTANEAKFKADSTKTELDQIVIEGDSSVEAAQARVDADGNPHTTLKERLDFEHNELSSQLAQTVTRVNDLGINVENYSSIQDAIDSIQYGRINLPSKVYEINEPIKIDANNIELTGVGSAVIKKSDDFVGDSLIKSLYEDRTKGSLENVIFKNLRLDGVDSSVNGIELSRLTRGSKIENVFVENANDGIRLSDSWSIQLIGNNIIKCTDSGIKLSGSINALTIMGNTVRHSNVGLKTYNIRGSAIIGNTFELNDINARLAGSGNVVSGNYFELPNEENVKLGSDTVSFSNNDFSGNFFNNVGNSRSAVYLINVVNNMFGLNHYVNVIYQYYLDDNSVVLENEFHTPVIPNITVFRKNDTSHNYGYFLGNNNTVYRASESVRNINDTGDGSDSTSSWRINTPSVNNWVRFGKLSSLSDDFTFTGDGVDKFVYGKPVLFGEDVQFSAGKKIGFFGQTPTTRKGVTGSSVEQKVDSLINVLKDYGLISP